MNVELSLAAFDTLWDDLRLGRKPFPLDVRSHGDTVGERARIRAAVYADLERRELARRGRADGELAEALGLLAEPSVSVDLLALLDRDEQPLKAVAGARGRYASLAVQRERGVSVATMRHTMIAGAIVELLPHTRAGAGEPIRQPVVAVRNGPEKPRRAAARPGSVLRGSAPRDAGGRELRDIAAIAARPRLRAGQLGVTVADRRLPGTAWFDTDQGRYATTREPRRDGTDWLSLWPADNPTLTTHLTNLLHTP